MADNSRISLAGLNSSNVAYMAEAILACLKAAKADVAGSSTISML